MPKNNSKNFNSSRMIYKLFTPILTAVGIAIKDFFDLKIGIWVHEKAEIRHLISEKRIANHKNKIYNDTPITSKKSYTTPIKSFQTPINKKEIKDIFDFSIIDNVDNKKICSYLEIIKQISPLDCQNLKLFKIYHSLPIAKFEVITKNKRKHTINHKITYSNIFTANLKCQNLKQQELSISSLCKIGLLEVSYDKCFSNNNFYESFTSLQLYKKLKKQVIKRNSVSKSQEKHILRYDKGIVRLTPIGKIFVSFL